MSDNYLKEDTESAMLSIELDGARLLVPNLKKSKSNQPSNKHIHPCYELVYVYSPQRATITVIPPRCEHMANEAVEGGYVIGLLFSLTGRGDGIYSPFRALTEPRIITDSFGADKLIGDALTAMSDRRFASDAIARAGFELLFARVSRELYCEDGVFPGKTDSHDDKRISILDDYFNHCHKDPNCNKMQLAEKLGVTERHLSRILKEYYGRSFADLLLEARMSIAKAMLERGERDFEIIAREVGYTSKRAFKNAYKSFFGSNPGGGE